MDPWNSNPKKDKHIKDYRVLSYKKGFAAAVAATANDLHDFNDFQNVRTNKHTGMR